MIENPPDLDCNCTDCRWDTMVLGEYYVVRDEVWQQACQREPYPIMLCIGCLEERLGRMLKPDDFNPSTLLFPTGGNSSRLRARLQGAIQ